MHALAVNLRRQFHSGLSLFGHYMFSKALTILQVCPAVTEEDVIDVLIPQLSKTETETIQEHVKESIGLRRDSDALLGELRRRAEEVTCPPKNGPVDKLE